MILDFLNALGRFWIKYGWLIVFCLLVGGGLGLLYVKAT